IVFSGKASRKCLTAAAIELTCPGVPVTACASMLPSRSKTPAERSPASRTGVENAVRIKVCACSSTTAINRDHMICMWICDSAVFGRESMRPPLPRPGRRGGRILAPLGDIDHPLSPEDPCHDNAIRERDADARRARYPDGHAVAAILGARLPIQ